MASHVHVLWTMKDRIAYKKLMLFHNIVNSSDERIISNIIGYQMENPRRGTWYSSIQILLDRYNLKWSSEIKKSQWKKAVKKQINLTTEEEIRKGCDTTKGRTVAQGKYETKQYLLEVTVEDAKGILRMRTHMVDIPCNYGERDSCWLCGKQETIRTEHYLECPGTELLRECSGIRNEQFSSLNTLELVKLSKFYQLVEKKNIHNQKLRIQKK